MDNAKKHFFIYLKKERPDIFKLITEKYHHLLSDDNLSSLGTHLIDIQTQDNDPSTTWGTQLLDIIKVAVPAYQQQQLFKLQIKRAEQGLDPVDPGLIAPTVNVDLPVAAKKQITVVTMAVVAAAVGLLVYLMVKGKK